MLIWKTQNSSPGIASVRYRCIFPSRALDKMGTRSLIYGRTYTLPLHEKVEAIIFVKSFSNIDLELCKTAHKENIPIILDLCDNIFIDDYGQGSNQDCAPKENFRKMAKLAAAIVTTGSVLKENIERNLETACPIWIIPDGCENLEDVEYALKISFWRRWFTLLKYEPSLLSVAIASDLSSGVRHLLEQITKQAKKLSSRVKKQIKKLSSRAKKQMKRIFNKIFKSAKLLVKRYIFQVFYPSSCLSNEASCSDLDGRDIQKETRPESREAILQEELISCEKGKTEAKKMGLKGSKNSTSRIQYSSRVDFLDQATDQVKTILWFGHHGSSYSQSGIVNILDVAPAVEKLSKEIPLCLLVVSNNYSKFINLIAPLPFTTAYEEWDPIKIYRYVSASDLVIIPNAKTPFALSKSANRAVLSLSLGIPVLATYIPSMDPFRKCILFDDWENGLRQYLTQPQLVNDHLQKAQTVIQANYQSDAIARQWVHILNSIHK